MCAKRKGNKSKSCYYEQIYARESMEQIRRQVEEYTEDMPERKKTMPEIQRKVWKRVTTKWREEQKLKRLNRAKTRYKALRYGTHQMLGKVHAVMSKWERRRMILWMMRDWPPRPKTCLICKAVDKRIEHFKAHAGEGESIAELDDISKAVAEMANRKQRGNTHLLREKTKQLKRGLEAYNQMWRQEW